MRAFARPLIAVLSLLALIASLITGSSPASAASARATTAKYFLQSNLLSLETNSGPTDPRFYANGTWQDGSTDCFRCELGPAVESALYSNIFGTPLTVPEASIDTAIQTHQNPDGSFGPPGAGESGDDLQTTLFGNELAETYLLLNSRLDAAHRAAWSTSLAAAADFLIKNGDLAWYINGNIALANAMLMDLTYRITGLPRFQTAAATAISFAISPDQASWPGYGLQYVTTPTKADGSDGSAYFAEKGSTGAPGFDASYTMMQDNVATFWYLLTNSPVAKRLANLLTNQLMTLVRTSDWTIDVSNGTRHPQSGLRYGFYVSAISALALRGGRTDLLQYVDSQTAAAMAAYKTATSVVSDGWSYSFGSELTPMLLVQATAG